MVSCSCTKYKRARVSSAPPFAVQVDGGAQHDLIRRLAAVRATPAQGLAVSRPVLHHQPIFASSPYYRMQKHLRIHRQLPKPLGCWHGDRMGELTCPVAAPASVTPPSSGGRLDSRATTFDPKKNKSSLPPRATGRRKTFSSRGI